MKAKKAMNPDPAPRGGASGRGSSVRSRLRRLQNTTRLLHPRPKGRGFRRRTPIKKITAIDTPYGNHRVVFERDQRRGYIATASDLPGVTTWGKNLAEAKQMVREAIELCVECMAEAQIAAEKVARPVVVRRPRERMLA